MTQVQGTWSEFQVLIPSEWKIFHFVSFQRKTSASRQLCKSLYIREATCPCLIFKAKKCSALKKLGSLQVFAKTTKKKKNLTCFFLKMNELFRYQRWCPWFRRRGMCLIIKGNSCNSFVFWWSCKQDNLFFWYDPMH